MGVTGRVVRLMHDLIHGASNWVDRGVTSLYYSKVALSRYTSVIRSMATVVVTVIAYSPDSLFIIGSSNDSSIGEVHFFFHFWTPSV